MGRTVCSPPNLGNAVFMIFFCKELDEDIAADGLSLFNASRKQMIVKENIPFCDKLFYTIVCRLCLLHCVDINVYTLVKFEV